MNTHINDFDTFISLSALNAKIINPENIAFRSTQLPIAPITEKGSEISTRSKTRVGRTRKNQIVNYVDYTNDNKVLISIQNNEKFLKMIKLISKPIEPSMYLYTEDDSIVCTISSNAFYPIIIARFMMQEPYIYLKNGISLCIQFPYRTILSFINKSEKQCSNYTLLIIQDQNQLKIEYHNSDHSQKDSTQNFKLMDNKNKIYEEIFKNKMIETQNPLFNPLIESNIDYYDKLQCMKLLFISEVDKKKGSNNSKTTKSEISQYLITVSENSIVMEITSNKKTSLLKLADKKPVNQNLIELIKENDIKDITPILYWNDEFINKKIRLISYVNIFKRADKLPNDTIDMVYYAICKYDVIPDADIYVLIKIITDKNIKDIVNQNINSPSSQFHDSMSMEFNSIVMSNEAPTFGNVFNNTNYICEFTVGIEDN
jgi:hypothetical protein